MATFTKSAASGNSSTAQPESAQVSSRLIRFRWRGIVTLVERVAICGGRLFVRLSAGQRTKASPTCFDQVHAGVCTLIVLQQPQYRRFGKRCHTSVSYTDGTTEPVSIDLDNLFLTLGRFSAAPGRCTHKDAWLVSPLVAYLILSDEYADEGILKKLAIVPEKRTSLGKLDI